MYLAARIVEILKLIYLTMDCQQKDTESLENSIRIHVHDIDGLNGASANLAFLLLLLCCIWLQVAHVLED